MCESVGFLFCVLFFDCVCKYVVYFVFVFVSVIVCVYVSDFVYE